MEIEEAVANGTQDILHKMHSNIDFGIRWIDSKGFDVDDLKELFPILRKFIIQRRLTMFNTMTDRRNKEKHESSNCKEMPATIDTVAHHIAN